MNKNILIIALSGIVLTLGILFFINKQLPVFSQEQIDNQQTNNQGTSLAITKIQSSSSTTAIAKSSTVIQITSTTTTNTGTNPTTTPAKVAENKTNPSVTLLSEDLLSGKWFWQYSTDKDGMNVSLDMGDTSKADILPNLEIIATTTDAQGESYNAKFRYHLNSCAGNSVARNFIIKQSVLIPVGKIGATPMEGCGDLREPIQKFVYDHFVTFFKTEPGIMTIVSITTNKLVLSYPEPKTFFYFTKTQ